MADSTSLTTDTTTQNGDVDIELFDGLGQLQRLTHDHASSFAAEEIIQLTVVDGNLASARTQEDARGCSLLRRPVPYFESPT